MQKRLETQGKEVEYDRVVIVPSNLMFTGTVNVDETTQPLSDKVIDHANTIEFFDIDLDRLPDAICRRPRCNPRVGRRLAGAISARSPNRLPIGSRSSR